MGQTATEFRFDEDPTGEARSIPHGWLADHAELVRRQLGCEAVLVRIEAQFVHLVDGGQNRTPPRSGRGGLCIHATARAGQEPALAQGRAPPELMDPLAAIDGGHAFYAALPLLMPSGNLLGVLVALDRAPRVLAAHEYATVRRMADLVVAMAATGLAGDRHPPRMPAKPAGTGSRSRARPAPAPASAGPPGLSRRLP